MITEATIRRIEAKTAAYRKDAVARLGQKVPEGYVHGLLIGCDGIEEIYQAMMQDQLRINERKNNVGKRLKCYKYFVAKTTKNKGGKKK